MAFKQISSIAFIADSREDLQNLPNRGMGAECYVIENATEYKQNSKGEWIAQTQSVVSEGGSNNEVIPQIQVDWEQMDDTAVDYIKNKPFGISYDEKIEGVWTPLGAIADFRYELSFPGIDTLDIELGGPVIKFAGPYYPTYCYYDSSTQTFNDIDTGEIYRAADSFFHKEQAWALTNFSKKTLDFIDLPIKQLDWLSQVNPVMDPAMAASEGSTEKTGQEAYDYAVSVNNNLLQLIESYNSLIEQLNSKGYVNQI